LLLQAKQEKELAEKQSEANDALQVIWFACVIVKSMQKSATGSTYICKYLMS
jgi:hypothetical protein